MTENILSKIERLEEELAELKEQLIKKDKYKPQGGKWVIAGSNEVTTCDLSVPNLYAKVGRAFDTEEKARKARDIMIKHDIILKYVIDHAPYYKPDSRDYNHGVYFDHDHNEWFYVPIDEDPELGIILMPKWVALKLVDDLNNNRIEGV